MNVRLYLIMVSVRYTHPDYPESARRLWPVRIVATTPESANLGAMNWAVLQKPDGLKTGGAAFAESASMIDVIGSVDCIGESVARLAKRGGGAAA